MNTTGQIIGDRYQIQQQLGKKAGRRTLLALDQQTGDRVVLKLLTFSSDFEWTDLRLFEREAETLQSLSHPAIPRYLNHFEWDTAEFKGFVLVQSYIEALSWEEHLKSGRTFSEAELRELAIALLDILTYLHSRHPPVIHRDIKPSNVLLGDRSGHSIGQVYLVDFGSVQTLAAVEGGTITIVGTYGYMPPEQFGGRAVPASDLYSLGATLIYLATGQHPADLPQEDLRIEFASVASALSPPMVRWLKRLTEPSLNRRYGSAQIALNALTHSEQAGESLVTQKPPGSRVVLHKDAETLEIILPPAGWSGEIGFLIPFAIAWNSGLAVLSPMLLRTGALLLFLLPFWTAGFYMVSRILVALFQHTHLRITPETLSVSYETLGFEYAPRSPIPVQAVQTLTRRNRKGWERAHLKPGLMLQAGVETLELGNSLTEIEIDWLTHELSDWLQLPVVQE